MDEDKMKGQWNQISGKAKEKWGELTSDDLDRIEGKRDQLVGTLQKKYGYAKEKAEREAEDFAGRC